MFKLDELFYASQSFVLSSSIKSMMTNITSHFLVKNPKYQVANVCYGNKNIRYQSLDNSTFADRT